MGPRWSLPVLAKALLRRAGLRVRRAGLENRFDAMEDALFMLAARGFRPRVAIDVGANRGLWTDLAVRAFPGVIVELVEPQAACQAALARFRPPQFRVHPVALTRPGIATVTMVGMTGDSRDTGARVVPSGEDLAHTGQRPATSLDALLGHVTPGDRTLLKLDVEGHEIAVLEGGTAMLRSVEVLVLEVQFYEIERNGLPVFADVVHWVRARGFELYDVAALAPRPRDGRLRMGDVIFVRSGTPLLEDAAWA